MTKKLLILAFCALISGSAHASSQPDPYDDSVKIFMEYTETVTKDILKPIILTGAAKKFTKRLYVANFAEQSQKFPDLPTESYAKRIKNFESKKALYYYVEYTPCLVYYLMSTDDKRNIEVVTKSMSPEECATLQQLISQEQES